MKALLNFFIFFICFTAVAQDVIHLTNGEIVACKILEISEEKIIYLFNKKSDTLQKKNVALLEYSNKTFEIINTVDKDITVYFNGGERLKNKIANAQANYFSINTLGLINSDATFFYERLFHKYHFGLGALAGVNFNGNASAMNFWLYFLGNTRKLYDIGGFFNFYSNSTSEKISFHIGGMIKMQSIRINYLYSDTTLPSNIITTKTINSKQIAYMGTFGTNVNFKNNFFLKTIIGLGVFKIEANYLNEFKDSYKDFDPRLKNNYLPKLYFGFNIGCRL